MIMDLPAAYQILGLPQGTPLKIVLVRYRHLVKIFHPDRFSSAEEKAFAEGELKKINNAREIIEIYWQKKDLLKKAGEGSADEKRPAGPEPKPNPNPGTAPGATKPEPSPSPSPAKLSLWQALTIAWNTEIEPTLKKWDKRMAVEDVLDDFDNPIRLTHDTKRRRFWLGIALILLADICWTWHSACQENPQPTSVSKEISRPTPAPLQGSFDQQEHRKKQLDEQLRLVKLEHERYFLRLQLDRSELAISQDILISDQIELKLKTVDLAEADRRRLQEMKTFHDRDRAVQEEQKNAIMNQLMQVSSTQAS